MSDLTTIEERGRRIKELEAQLAASQDSLSEMTKSRDELVASRAQWFKAANDAQEIVVRAREIMRHALDGEYSWPSHDEMFAFLNDTKDGA